MMKRVEVMQTVRKLFNDWWLIHSGTGKSLGRTREGGGRSGRRVVERGRKKEKTKPLKKYIFKAKKKKYKEKENIIFILVYSTKRTANVILCVCARQPSLLGHVACRAFLFYFRVTHLQNLLYISSTHSNI